MGVAGSIKKHFTGSDTMTAALPGTLADHSGKYRLHEDAAVTMRNAIVRSAVKLPPRVWLNE